MDSKTLETIKRNQDLWIKRVTDQTSPYEKDFLGLSITVLPEVFPPSGDSRLLGKNTVIQENDTVLDMCCGSGAQSVLAMMRGARNVVAIDINPNAIENTNINAAKFGFRRLIDARIGDLFLALSKNDQFDVVLFNPPFMNLRPKTMFERSIRDENLATTKLFFEGIGRFLRETGKVYTVFSNWGGLDLIKSLAGSNMLSVRELASRTNGLERYVVFESTIERKNNH